MAKAARIEDAGVKIGGARKDYAQRRMELDDLASMTNEEAVTLVTRDNIWPQPDFEAMVESGVTPFRAALIRAVRLKIAKTPNFGVDADPRLWRDIYLRHVSTIRDMMENQDIADDRVLAAVSQKLSDQAEWVEFRIVMGAKTFPWDIRFNEMSRVRKAVEEGFPGKPPVWGKGVTLMQDPREKTKVSFVAVKDYRLLLPEGFPTMEELKAALTEKFAQKAEAAKTAPKEKKLKTPPDRPHLDRVSREGPSVREGDIRAEDFVEQLGFRGVEFGNWVAQDERQSLLNMGWDAIHDLAEVIGVEPRDVSLGGTLAIAFGARGQSGYAAHYEPGRRVFNMTKLSGAGALAHEFAHAIDHWAGAIDFDGVSQQVRSGTGWYSYTKDFYHRLLNLKPEERAGWAAMTEALFNKTPTAAEVAAKMRLNNDERRAGLDGLEKNWAAYNADLESGKRKGRDLKWERRVKSWIPEEKARIAANEKRASEIEASGQAPAGVTYKTDFFNEALKIEGKLAKNGETSYRLRPTEMFARAFESYVYDQLKAQERTSEYLVHGVDEALYADKDTFKGNPYPSGDERTEINRVMKIMVEAMAPRIREAGLAMDAAPAMAM